MNENTKKLLLRFEPFVSTHESAIENFIKKLEIEKEQKLPQTFEDKLNTLGRTPLDEPKINRIREEDKENEDLSDEEKYLNFVEALYTIDEIEDMNKEDDDIIKTLVKLGSRIEERIFGVTYEDGDKNIIFKEVQSQDNLKPLAYIQKKELKKLKNSLAKQTKEAQEFSQKVYANIYDENADKDKVKLDMEEAKNKWDEVAKVAEQVNEKILKMSGLDYEVMCEWEKELLIQKLIANAEGRYTPKLGKK